MRQSVIALAVGAALAGAASAQTANVTLYGLVDTYVANVRTSAGRTAAGGGGAPVASASVSVVDAGGLSGSRWGIRGSESLGGGVNAVFTLEGGINSDVGSAAQGGLLFGRQAFVGLSGGFGTLTLGRQYAPAFYVVCAAGADGCGNFSHEANHILLQLGSTTLRIDNSVYFKTANMAGFTAAAMYAFGENPAGTSRNRMIGFNAEYSNGPIYVGAGWGDRKNAAGATAQRTWLLGGSFSAPMAKLSAIYGESKFVFPQTFKFWQLGANVPFGNVTLVAQYGQGKSGAAKQELINLGATYAMSKRTDLYARFANADNNAFSNINAAGMGGVAQQYGADKRAIAVGIRHRF
ncbi:MAG: porin [Casimicrobiaceae bacterium]|nr:porin [Casimicrobiaceae bacterium]MCX8097778.1 porin [Casimicrobiaceae bacterium]MDW8311879.1 porin [Burkholderiales bacterium]